MGTSSKTPLKQVDTVYRVDLLDVIKVKATHWHKMHQQVNIKSKNNNSIDTVYH